MIKDEQSFRAFAEWWAMPKGQRAALRLPQTQKEFAATRGLTDRTLRRWREEEWFHELVEEARDRFRLTPEVWEASEDDEDPSSVDYRHVRRALVDSAKAGDRTALDLYMKHFGRPYVEAEQASLDSRWPELSDDELVSEVLRMIGVGPVRAWLEAREREEGEA